jgi:hypothetical protein
VDPEEAGKMAHNISYSEDKKILIRTFKGKVSFAEVLASWQDLVHENRIGEEILGILNDFTYAELMMDRDNLEQLMSFFMSRADIFERIRLAVVMMLPENIVLPVLASQRYPQFKIEAFSTLDAAEAWLRSE